MKFCPKCGNPLDDKNLKFCSKCGNSLENNEEPEMKEESIHQSKPKLSKKSNTKVILIALVLIIACAGGYFGYNKYQENQQEKERIAQEQALEEQKVKEEQEKKEKEEQEKKEQEELAEKANANKTILYAIDNRRYLQYMDLIGEPLAIVMTNYNNDITNGMLDAKSYKINGEIDDKMNKINWINLKLSEPIYAENIMNAMSNFPLAILDKEKGYFLENDVNLGNGHIVKIYYYIDQTTLNVINIEITEVDLKNN